MTQHPFQITAPFTASIAPDSSGTLQITNTGSQALTVHESVGRLSPLALKYPAASGATVKTMGQPWLVATPSHFTLAPGASETVRVTSHVPAGVQGSHYLNLIWSAQPAHAVSGPLHLAGAVATTIGIPMPGVAVPVGPGRLPAAPIAPGHGGLSGLDLGGIALVPVLALAAVAVAWRRRRRHVRAAS